MKENDFRPGFPGKLERTIFRERIFTGTRIDVREVPGVGFVPDPLPPKLDLGGLLVEIHDAVVAASSKLAELAAVARDLQNPYILIGPFSAREARDSSAIENTYASAQQLALFDIDPNAIDRESVSEVTEVRNYVRALEHGFQSDRPLCCSLFLEMHEILLTDVKRDAGTPGQFRTTQNAIGSKESSFENAKFVPPPPAHVSGCMNDLERYINTAESKIPLLARMAMVHYQFESIHPFDDGNGRLGRLLIALQLCKQGPIRAPLVYISGFFEKNRQSYYQKLYNVSTQGDWIDWIKFFLTAVVTQADDACVRATKLLKLRTDYLERVREKRASGALPILIDKLFEHPILTVSLVCKLANVTSPAASQQIRRLIEKRILQEYPTGRQRKKLYIATEILDVTD